MAEDHGIDVRIRGEAIVPELPLHATYHDANETTDGLAHFVMDGQLGQDDIVSLCGIHVEDGTWRFPINDVSVYMLPLCPPCRAAAMKLVR